MPGPKMDDVQKAAEGEALKNLRMRHGYAEATQLAKALGVTKQAVGGWESGTNRPKIEHLAKLHELFHRDPEVLGIYGIRVGTTSDGERTSSSTVERDRLRREMARGVHAAVESLQSVLRRLEDPTP